MPLESSPGALLRLEVAGGPGFLHSLVLKNRIDRSIKVEYDVAARLF
jgi:hypothetical protein